MAALVALTLHLACIGNGERRVNSHTTGVVADGAGGVAYGAADTTSRVGFVDQLDIDIVDGVGAARVPRRFLPLAHGGHGGVFDIKDLAADDDTITGTILINYAQHPKLRIDRRSGIATLNGKVGAFTGQCSAYSADAKRAF